MPVLKAPPSQPKNETIQLRVPQDVKFRLARYSEFIQASPSYVVIEMLERLFRKDGEFQDYLARCSTPQSTTEQSPTTNEQARASALNIESSSK